MAKITLITYINNFVMNNNSFFYIIHEKRKEECEIPNCGQAENVQLDPKR